MAHSTISIRRAGKGGNGIKTGGDKISGLSDHMKHAKGMVPRTSAEGTKTGGMIGKGDAMPKGQKAFKGSY